MSRLRHDMRLTRTHPGASSRAQTVSLGCSFALSSSWPADLFDQVATLLADALVNDIRDNPIPEWPPRQLPT
jgi:hypothetical protein